MPQYFTQTSDKSKKEALRRCLIGGWFGWHQYYVGNIGKGLIYTFTFGFLCLGWITDIIKITTGSFRDNVGVPLRK